MSRTYIFLIALFWGAANLHGAIASDLIGTWVGDGEATWEAQKTTAEKRAFPKNRKHVIKDIGNLTMNITADKIISHSTMDGWDDVVDEVAYKVQSIAGDRFTLKFTGSYGVISSTAELKGAELRITQNVKDGEAIVFRKAEATEKKTDQAR